MSNQDHYALGRSGAEHDRLMQQAQFAYGMTRRLLEEAGLVNGMRVLDVGCGAGDVSLLIAEMVGPEGTVVGMDMDDSAVHLARTRCERLGVTQVSFVCGNYAVQEVEEGFDAVVGRLTLMYQQDPAAALRYCTRNLRPGAIVAFLEPIFSLLSPGIMPGRPYLRDCASWIIETLRRSGAQVDLGLQLHQIFLDAGLPAPQLRFEMFIDAGKQSKLYDYCADTLRSLLPAAERLEVVTAKEAQVDRLADRLREEANVARTATAVLPLVGAWCRNSR